MPHIFNVHQGGGQVFYCRETCARCCTDIGAPLELLLSDIQKLSKHLGLSNEEFFKRYGGILWSNIPGTTALIPSTGLPFPCKFLENGKCTIYEVRPLHCRLFPERLYINPSQQTFEPFYGAGYQCVDEGVYLDDKRNREVREAIDEDQTELRRTADYFKNDKYIYELSEPEYREVQERMLGIDWTDPERNRLKREIIEGIIPSDFKKSVEEAFIQNLKNLGERSREMD